MKTENEIKAIIESAANGAYRRSFEQWEIKERCIDKSTYKQTKDGYWFVKFAIIEILPNMSTLLHMDTIISNRGGKNSYLYTSDNGDLFIKFIVR